MLRTTPNNQILVIDDFIPLSYQEKYKEWLLSGKFPWFYTADVTSQEAIQQRPCMSHVIYDNGAKASTIEVDILAHLGASKFGWAFNAIAHAKTILQFPLNPDVIGTEIDTLHTDIEPHYPHLVVLYYVIDADGDTIICDLKNDGKSNGILRYNDHKILQRVTPKQGRAVLFDGSYFHTAEQPKNGMRCIINLNIF